MDVLNIIKRRSSIRAFKPDLVPKELIEKIITAGIAAPSKGNSQIWEFVIVGGTEKKELDSILLNLLKTELIPSMKLSVNDDIPGNDALLKAKKRSSRNREAMKKVLSPLGMTVNDFMLEGTFTFFSAPIAILVFVEEVFAKDLPHILSVGSAVENMLLTAEELELGTCWIGGVWRYTKDIIDFLKIEKGKKLLSSVALGYPDLDSPVNKYKAERDPVKDFTTWIGFNKGE